MQDRKDNGKVAKVYPTLYVDAFGHLDPIPERVAPDSEYRPDPENPLDGYLWAAFLNRSVQMRWSTAGSAGTSRVWDVEEAELTYHLGSSRIGFAQVGLEVKGATPDIARMRALEPRPGRYRRDDARVVDRCRRMGDRDGVRSRALAGVAASGALCPGDAGRL